MLTEPRQHVHLPRHELQRGIVHVRQPYVLQRDDAAGHQVLPSVHGGVRPLPDFIHAPVRAHVPRSRPSASAHGVARVPFDPRGPPGWVVAVGFRDEVRVGVGVFGVVGLIRAVVAAG